MSLSIDADDPLAPLKRRVLKRLAGDSGGGGDGGSKKKSDDDATATAVAALPTVRARLAAARALVLRTDEVERLGGPDAAEAWIVASSCAAAAADGGDGSGTSGSITSVISPRNEAAALALLLAADGVVRSEADCAELAELAAGYCSRAGAPDQQLPTSAAAPTGHDDASLAAAAALQRWAELKGLSTALEPAAFAGGLRGLAVAPGRGDGGLAAGDAAVTLPEALLITYNTALESDFGRALARIPAGLGEDAIAVIWTMVERHDADADAAPFWAALPDAFHTGLTAPAELVALLDGTPAGARAAAARASLDADFRALAPVFEALLRAYSQHLKPEWFTREAFEWATGLWYAYAIQVRLSSGDTTTALVPFVSLLNHSPWPHVVRFSAVDPTARALVLRVLRPAAPGAQVFLSYGDPLPNAETLLFYGFTTKDNPSETVEVDLAGSAASTSSSGGGKLIASERSKLLGLLNVRANVALHRGWRLRQMDRLLAAARVLAADAATVRARLKRAAAARGGEWPEAPLPQGASEEAAAALVEAAVQSARRPYAAALERLRQWREEQQNQQQQIDGSSSSSSSSTSDFASHIETLLTDSLSLLDG